MLILCADDYALTEGVSRAIGELSAARRLSATSVLATMPHWPRLAPRLSVHRGHLAIGLHFNLTLGAPLGPMPRLAPSGVLPAVGTLISRAFLGRVSRAEVVGELERQLDCFERHMAFPPDHIDGHQHVHVLPGVRRAVLETVARRYPSRPPLIRDPSDRWEALKARPVARRKAAAVAGLALGFAAAARRRGLPVNEGFSGFSDFDQNVPYADELHSAFAEPGPRHIVMCHPGHPDAELARNDPVVGRRRTEYETMMADAALPARIWRPSRHNDGPPVDWASAGA